MDKINRIKSFLNTQVSDIKKENSVTTEKEETLLDIIDFIEKLEEEEKNKEILAMSNELNDLLDYDEWAAREYGETRIDVYGTAINLYNAGYRKVANAENESN